MRTATLTTETLNRLNILTEKIRTNTASASEYGEYERLLINSGAFTKQEVQSHLAKADLHSYEALILRRTTKTLEERKFVEGAVVVGLVALGLALIFSGGTKK